MLEVRRFLFMLCVYTSEWKNSSVVKSGIKSEYFKVDIHKHSLALDFISL